MGKGRAKGFLTERQLKVLELRRRGLNHEQIAEILKTTRENVVILERRALRNIKLAVETLEYAAAVGGLVVRVPGGTRVLEIPQLIVREADKAGIKLAMSMPELAVEVSNKIRGKAERGVLKMDIEVLVLPNGALAVVPASGD